MRFVGCLRLNQLSQGFSSGPPDGRAPPSLGHELLSPNRNAPASVKRVTWLDNLTLIGRQEDSPWQRAKFSFQQVVNVLELLGCISHICPKAKRLLCPPQQPLRTLRVLFDDPPQHRLGIGVRTGAGAHGRTPQHPGVRNRGVRSVHLKMPCLGRLGIRI